MSDVTKVVIGLVVGLLATVAMVAWGIYMVLHWREAWEAWLLYWHAATMDGPRPWWFWAIAGWCLTEMLWDVFRWTRPAAKRVFGATP